MNSIDTNQLLSQLRMAAAQAKGQPSEPAAPAGQAEGDKFSSFLKESINSVNELSQTSGDLKTKFEMGDPNVKLNDVMLAGAKADLAFNGMVQVRNKVIEAYQEIMRMQV